MVINNKAHSICKFNTYLITYNRLWVIPINIYNYSISRAFQILPLVTDTKVSSGGYEKTRNSYQFDITGDKPFGNGWKVSFVSIAGIQGSDSLTVYAKCA